MADETRDTQSNDLSRREFVGLSVAAGLAAAASTSAAAQGNVTETNVEVKTPDGTCDAAFIHPVCGSHAAVIIWPDAFGLRPAMRDMAKRLAADGYTVLVPNPFYRATKAPGIKMEGFSFQNAENMAELRKLMGGIAASGAAERDAQAFVAWLDTQKQVDRSKKIGVQGYCMGGPLTFRTAAAVPDRVGRRRVVPRRRARHTGPGQPAHDDREDEGRACTSPWRPTTTPGNPRRRTC